MNAAGYIRVSSRAQTYETQRAAIDRAATARGDAIGEWYVERRSGKKLARPDLDRLRANVRTGIVRRIYAFRLDRFTRSGVEDTFAFAKEVKDAGGEVITVADNVHLKPGDGDIQTAVFLFALGLAAQIERIAINDRMAAARDRLEAEGRPWGRPSRMDAETVARARRLRQEGRTVRECAVALKVPRATLARALKPLSRNPTRDEGGAEPAPVLAEQGAAQ